MSYHIDNENVRDAAEALWRLETLEAGQYTPEASSQATGAATASQMGGMGSSAMKLRTWGGRVLRGIWHIVVLVIVASWLYYGVTMAAAGAWMLFNADSGMNPIDGTTAMVIGYLLLSAALDPSDWTEWL